ncbi:MAG TPA: hypothetical protein VFD00_09325, partial [Thermoclostridium sp.]|nr:hypothetical protein [Thermoclostridium sp.]
MGIFKKSVVGIEIDTTEIRAVNLSGSSDKPQLLSYGRQSLKKGIVNDGAVLEPKMLVEAIIGLWETN